MNQVSMDMVCEFMRESAYADSGDMLWCVDITMFILAPDFVHTIVLRFLCTHRDRCLTYAPDSGQARFLPSEVRVLPKVGQRTGTVTRSQTSVARYGVISCDSIW